MYRFDFTAGAEDDLDRLDPPTRTRILKRLKWLGENAEIIQHEELSGELKKHSRWQAVEDGGELRIIPLDGERL
jgi:mRNA-degrading endonuclease RelE of RelBE toxin-antitoxin system